MRRALIVAAAVLITTGVAFVFWPAALIVGGGFVGAAAVFSDE